MEDSKKLSFSAANVFPIKLFLDGNLAYRLQRGYIPCYHIQLNPTNKCNFKCDFCSCGKVDRAVQFEWEELKGVMMEALRCGMKAITITGGGEPLMYPQINELFHLLGKHGVSIGMVTNGTLLNRLDDESRRNLSWLRISASDNLESQLEHIRRTLDSWFAGIERFIEGGMKGQTDYSTGENIRDIAFSYVVGTHPKSLLILKLIHFANEHDFSNVRLVPDLNRLDQVPLMSDLRNSFKGTVDDEIVNYQDRAEYKPGDKECWISLLKAFISADGYVYPCCGVQYAKGETLDFDETMRMGKAVDIDKIIQAQKPFDGTDCLKCYYHHYNQLLGYYKNSDMIIGKEFV